MLKYGEINPLNVMGLRQLPYCPPHFEKIFFDIRVNDKYIVDWIYQNLQGRFWYGDYCKIQNGSRQLTKCVAFEEHAESTVFLLSLDKINIFKFQ